MTSPTPNELAQKLAGLGFCCLPAQLDDFLARAIRGRWDPRTLLEEMAQMEAVEKARRSLERRLRTARIGRFKPLADFDWDWPKKIDRPLIEQALTLDFIRQGRNLILLGANGLGKTMKYARPALLCIDEIGYLSYDTHAADLLYEVVNRRYEQRSIIVTTNRAFKDWNAVFPNATSIVSLLDRLTHHAEITLIEGQSYRRRESEQEAAARRNKA